MTLRVIAGFCQSGRMKPGGTCTHIQSPAELWALFSMLKDTFNVSTPGTNLTGSITVEKSSCTDVVVSPFPPPMLKEVST